MRHYYTTRTLNRRVCSPWNKLPFYIAYYSNFTNSPSSFFVFPIAKGPVPLFFTGLAKPGGVPSYSPPHPRSMSEKCRFKPATRLSQAIHAPTARPFLVSQAPYVRGEAGPWQGRVNAPLIIEGCRSPKVDSRSRPRLSVQKPPFSSS